jgi:hypothetical protein
VGDTFSVLIPYDSHSASRAARTATEALQAGAGEVVLSGETAICAPPGAQTVHAIGGRGAAVRQALSEIHTDCTILVEPWVSGFGRHLAAVSGPVRSGQADVVLLAQPRGATAVAHRLAQGMSELAHPLAPVRALRTSALRGLKLVSEGAASGRKFS